MLEKNIQHVVAIDFLNSKDMCMSACVPHDNNHLSQTRQCTATVHITPDAAQQGDAVTGRGVSGVLVMNYRTHNHVNKPVSDH